MDEKTEIGKNAVIYIHGKGGNAGEAAHYRSLFPGSDVKGFDYKAQTPWEAEEEFSSFFDEIYKEYGPAVIVANSIGAWFTMCAGIGEKISRAFFISPVVDMNLLIDGMLKQAGITEAELRSKGSFITVSGELLTWKYLRYVRDHPVSWHVPTEILYGSLDCLTSFETISSFARRINAGLTVMENGEHWFHTDCQMSFVDDWIRKNR